MKVESQKEYTRERLTAGGHSWALTEELCRLPLRIITMRDGKFEYCPLPPVSLAEDFSWDIKFLVLLGFTCMHRHKLSLMWDKVLREAANCRYLR